MIGRNMKLEYGARGLQSRGGLGDKRPIGKWAETPPNRTGGNGMIVNGGMVMQPFQLLLYNNFGVPADASTSTHPFKLYVNEDLELRVEFGMVFTPNVSTDSNSDRILTWQSRNALIDIGGTNEGYLTNHPNGLTEGFLELSASTTYGVYLKISDGSPITRTTGTTNAVSVNAALNDSWYDAVMYGPTGASAIEIVVDSTNYNIGSEVSMLGVEAGSQYILIGIITIDGSSNVTIKQLVKESIYAAHWVLPTDFGISSDSNNDLLSGGSTGDGRLWIKLLSSDSPNALATGTDGALKYDDSGVVKTLVGGTDISVTPGGSGSWTIDYTGA